jgi:hypothetical protein
MCVGDIKFTSCTYRLFKSTSVTSDNDKGALVTYETPITRYENEFQLDQCTTFKV